MDKYKWLNKLEYKKFVTPFIIERDDQYFDDLRLKYQSLISQMEEYQADDEMLKIARLYVDNIIRSIELYYRGDIGKSQEIMDCLLDDCLNDSIAVSNINNSIAFSEIGHLDDMEVQFYRARLNDNVTDFNAKNMLHIPFNKRGIIKSERFSIPGLPCLYLGNTSYVCWLEMNMPADFRFNVSPIRLDNTQKVLNLTVGIRDFFDVIQDETMKEEDKENYIFSMLKLLILAIATSYKVKDGNRSFKSEYIISQMIMLSCKNRGLDGITYFSKCVSDEIFARVVGINVVLFAKYNGESEYSDICNHLEVDDSFNFAMFKQLLLPARQRHYNLRIDRSPYIQAIGTFDRHFSYLDTEFYEFDKFLFGMWEDNKRRARLRKDKNS